MNAMQYLSRENVESIWKLSLLQRRFFQGKSLPEDAPNHRISVTFTLEGRLDGQTLQKAWQRTLHQTPLLRTVFRKAKNQIVQVVMKEWPVPLDILDGPAIKQEEQSMLSLLREPSQGGKINLLEEPAVIVKLFRNTDDSAVLLMSSHCTILDKKGLLSVFSDFLTIYNHLAAGSENEPVPRPSFKHYLDWLAHQYWVPALTQWKETLAGFQSPTSLTRYTFFDKNKKYPPSTLRRPLSPALSAGLEKLSQEYGVSPDAVVLAAWALLLHLYTRETELIFGVEHSGSPAHLPDFQHMIGPFANTLPLKVTIDLKQELKEFITGIEEKNTQLLRDSFIPLEEIRANAGMDPESRLFETSVSVSSTESTVIQALEQAGQINPGQVDSWQERTHPFALDVFTGKQWQMTFFCQDERVSGDFSLEVVNRLEFLLDIFQKNSHAALYQLNFLSARDVHIMEMANQSQVPGIPLKTLECMMPVLFENQVEQKPTAIACCWRDRHITYRQLNRCANQWAHRLKEEGIGPNQLVGIFGERRISMLIAILAVFKAGGAYVPLDTNNPDSRLKTVISDTRPRVIFTQKEFLERTLELVTDLSFPVSVLCLDSLIRDHNVPDAADMDMYPGNNLPVTHSSRDAAYVIFTSGSTGTPKGVVVKHIGMINHLQTKVKLLDITGSDIVAQNASHCFDISVWQLLCAVMTGGKTVIYDTAVAMDPTALLGSVQNHCVTILELVPAVIDIILREIPKGSKDLALPELKMILSTGDALTTALCRKWLETYPHIPVINAYGPSECSDDTHHKVISAPDQLDQRCDDVPLGKIIPNFEVYILNRERQQLPPGCPGEICLTGIGVGKGYLNNPERTAAAFLKNPFARHMNERMYRTGDLGYVDSQGELVFLGRIDFQVKVRGHRIELGEIEIQLQKYESVKQCVAIVRKDGNNHNRIIAYVVLKDSLSTAVLRHYLENRLPQYMVPDYILEIRQIPLNHSGKVDRKALPDPALHPEEGDAAAPRTDVEKTLVEIWEEVLEISPIGITHNFFQLGGNSLKAVLLTSKIHKTLNVDVPLGEIFKTPVINELAQYIKNSRGRAYIPIEPIEEKEYYILASAQKRLYITQHVDPGNTHYNTPVTMVLEGKTDRIKLEQTFIKLIERHESLRTSFHIIAGEPIQKVHDHVEFKIEYYRAEPKAQNAGPKEEHQAPGTVRCVNIIKNFVRPFNLSRAPLLRVGLVRTEEEKYILVVDSHHIISDGISLEILVKDFTTLYHGNSLPMLRLQYKDFSEWQDKLIASGMIKQQEEYWLNRFKGDIPVLNINMLTDYQVSNLESFAGNMISFEINKDLTGKIKRLVLETETTFYIALLTVYTILLAKYTQQEDIIVGSATAGRRHVDLENIIGMFVNMLTMRNHPTARKTFREFLGEVKKNAIDAYENQDYQFDQLVIKLGIKREYKRNPIFDTQFTFQNMEGESIELTGLKLKPYRASDRRMGFYLLLIGSETGETITMAFSYLTALFKKTTVEKMAKQYIEILEQVLENKDILLEDIKISHALAAGKSFLSKEDSMSFKF